MDIITKLRVIFVHLQIEDILKLQTGKSDHHCLNCGAISVFNVKLPRLLLNRQ
jgi:hypothetical protein